MADKISEVGCSGITETGMLWSEKAPHVLKCREGVWTVDKRNGGLHGARGRSIKARGVGVGVQRDKQAGGPAFEIVSQITSPPILLDKIVRRTKCIRNVKALVLPQTPDSLFFCFCF